jgi:hypothetical protein
MRKYGTERKREREKERERKRRSCNGAMSNIAKTGVSKKMCVSVCLRVLVGERERECVLSNKSWISSCFSAWLSRTAEPEPQKIDLTKEKAKEREERKRVIRDLSQ